MPISNYLARKRLAVLGVRVRRLEQNIADDDKGAVSYYQSELSALQWAIEELRALYPEHQPPRPPA